MPVLPSSCFLGLPPQERLEQIYLALGGEDSGCFLGQTLMEQLREMLALIGSEACIFIPDEFWSAWLLYLDPEACVGLTEQGLMQAVYALLYAQAGDTALPPPECFLGLGPDGMLLALFEAIAGVGTCWILAGGEWNDSCVWIDTETWND